MTTTTEMKRTTTPTTMMTAATKRSVRTHTRLGGSTSGRLRSKQRADGGSSDRGPAGIGSRLKRGGAGEEIGDFIRTDEDGGHRTRWTVGQTKMEAGLLPALVVLWFPMGAGAAGPAGGRGPEFDTAAPQRGGSRELFVRMGEWAGTFGNRNGSALVLV